MKKIKRDVSLTTKIRNNMNSIQDEFYSHDTNSSVIELTMDRTDFKKVIVLLNKIDLERKIDLDEYNFENIVEISAQKNVGIEDMEEKIYSFIVDEKVEDSSEKLIITNVRHKTALEKTKDAIRNIFETIDMGLPMDLISVDLKEALDSLSEITGEISSEDILDHVFGNFCVGK